MRKIRIYFEGGGNTDSDRRPLKTGFSKFVNKIFHDRKLYVQVIPCGGRGEAYRGFKNAIIMYPEEYIILLVDSETFVEGLSPWEHLRKRQGDNWEQIGTEKQCHLMAQVMETWFIADSEKLAEFYGKHFDQNKLPQRNDLEAEPKDDVYKKLEQATQETAKGKYSKAPRVAGGILEHIRVDKVRKLPFADRFFSILEADR